VGAARAFIPALAAVGGVDGEIDAGTLASFGAIGATAGAGARVAHLAGGARFVAAAAVAGVRGRLDAGTGAVGVARIADGAALAAFAGGSTVGGCVANLTASAAVVGAGPHVDASTVTLLRAFAAVELALRVDASRGPLGRARAA
jgi:hypothetical protein